MGVCYSSCVAQAERLRIAGRNKGAAMNSYSIQYYSVIELLKLSFRKPPRTRDQDSSCSAEYQTTGTRALFVQTFLVYCAYLVGENLEASCRHGKQRFRSA